jgi:hypothetical protein
MGRTPHSIDEALVRRVLANTIDPPLPPERAGNIAVSS